MSGCWLTFLIIMFCFSRVCQMNIKANNCHLMLGGICLGTANYLSGFRLWAGTVQKTTPFSLFFFIIKNSFSIKLFLHWEYIFVISEELFLQITLLKIIVFFSSLPRRKKTHFFLSSIPLNVYETPYKGYTMYTSIWKQQCHLILVVYKSISLG